MLTMATEEEIEAAAKAIADFRNLWADDPRAIECARLALEAAEKVRPSGTKIRMVDRQPFVYRETDNGD